MSKENDEKVVQEIIEYANNEIKKSKKKHLVILLSILISIVILSAVLVLVFTVEGGQMMCLPFGIVAVVAGILNVIWTLRRRETKWFSYISLSFTTLTLCAYYSLAKQWVLANAADQLLDVMPTLSDVLWFLTIASVMLNGICLFVKTDK
ncbi:MAG: hypothetical protein IKW08_09190 [Roseburia sp.]|nr:hypothetical protein [Roseburia sp.]